VWSSAGDPQSTRQIKPLFKLFGGGIFVAIADDIIGCIKPEAVLPAFRVIEERFLTLNLQLNYEKSTIFSNSQDTINMINFTQSVTLQKVRTTTEGLVLLGSTVCNNIEFHKSFIQRKIDEAKHVLHAITLFGKEFPQQAFVLLKSCYMTKFSYLSRVTPPNIFEPFTFRIVNGVRMCVSTMIEHSLTDLQWGQCLLKPRHGGLGIMNITTTSKGAYLASLLACLPNIDSIDKHQNLGLNALQFDHYGMPHQLNTFEDALSKLYAHD